MLEYRVPAKAFSFVISDPGITREARVTAIFKLVIWSALACLYLYITVKVPSVFVLNSLFNISLAAADELPGTVNEVVKY